jgi:endonuclease/exonuclease/phosphatase family metal-dependent hydrolase
VHDHDHVALRLVTWNVAGRVTRQPAQAAAVTSLAADVVALQEVTARGARGSSAATSTRRGGSCPTAT